MRHKLRAATDSYRNRLQRLLCEHAAALSDWRDLHLTPGQLHRLNEEITTAGVPLAGLVLIASPIRRRRDLPIHQGSGVPATAADSSRVRTA